MTVEVAGDGVDVAGGKAVGTGAPAVLEGEFGEAVEGARDAGGELVEERGGFGIEELASGVSRRVEAVGEVGGGLVGSGEGSQVVAETDTLVEGWDGLDAGAEVGLADEEDGQQGSAATVEIGEPAQAVEGVCGEVLGFIAEQDDVATGGGFGFEQGADPVEPLQGGGGRRGVGSVEASEQGSEEVVHLEAAVFEDQKAKAGGWEVVLKDRADEGFAAADLAGEQSEVQAALVDDVGEAIEGFLVTGRRVKETGVPSGLKGSENEVPVEKGIGHGRVG